MMSGTSVCKLACVLEGRFFDKLCVRGLFCWHRLKNCMILQMAIHENAQSKGTSSGAQRPEILKLCDRGLPSALQPKIPDSIVQPALNRLVPECVCVREGRESLW